MPSPFDPAAIIICGNDGLGNVIQPGVIGDILTSTGPSTPPQFVPPVVVVNNSWPIDSIFIGAIPTNPSIMLGFGTWIPFATGRVLVGFDITQPEFDTAGEMGGEKEHTLTLPEIPSHSHTQAFTTNPTVGSEGSMGSDGPSDEGFVGETQVSGGGLAHNNLQPYIVVFMWKRTA